MHEGRLNAWRVVFWGVCLSLLFAACSPFRPADDPAPPETLPDDTPAVIIDDEDDVIEIEYWQYNYGADVTAMDILIEQFHAQHPHIRVVHNYETAYDDFLDVMAARIPAGVGPDVISLFYGWQTDWIDAGYLVPLPEEFFPHQTVRAEFVPMIEAGFLDGELYTLPTAVRTAALFYNKDLLTEAGLNPDNPPSTLAELESQAVQCTQRSEDGSYEIMGFPVAVNGLADLWFREVLLRQFGQAPYSEDRRTVQWNASPAGYAAWAQLVKFQAELETGDAVLFENDPNLFLTGQACFHIDTSFRLEIIAANAPDMHFGVIELPTYNEDRHTFAAYWTHGLTPKGASSPERLEASAQFLHFITRAEAGRLWLDIVGELPAQRAAVEDEVLRHDLQLGPFIAGLDYAHAPFIVDEEAERAALAAAYDAVVFDGANPAGQLDAAVDAVQAIFDDFWARR